MIPFSLVRYLSTSISNIARRLSEQHQFTIAVTIRSRCIKNINQGGVAKDIMPRYHECDEDYKHSVHAKQDIISTAPPCWHEMAARNFG